MKKTKSRREQFADFDSVWKDAIELYFEAFIQYFFAQGHALIDWTRGVEFLDTELKRAVRNAVAGRGHVDKLVKVYLTTGVEIWIVIHIEVQTQKDGQFELRMYVYNYRIFDRYRRPVISLAILADDDPAWRPNAYGYDMMGCAASLHFPSAKLSDFRSRMHELETSANPFAVLVLAHLKTQETHRSPEQRLSAKIALIKGLRRRGLDKTQILELFRLIDGMMTLPDDLDRKFESDVAELEREESMPYMTKWEKNGFAKGKVEGKVEGILEGKLEGKMEGAIENAHDNLLILLEERFGTISDKTLESMRCISDLSRLRALMRIAVKTGSLKEFLTELK